MLQLSRQPIKRLLRNGSMDEQKGKLDVTFLFQRYLVNFVIIVPVNAFVDATGIRVMSGHYGPKKKKTQKKNNLIILFPTSYGVSKVSEQISERSGAQRSAQVRRAGRSKGMSERCWQTDERVAQYLHLDSWLFWTIVLCNVCTLSSITY